ncbi:MAG: head completion/stabilization protein [Gammaproteobacteria bacterium]|nr:head completion/stabilization protein [Gammaproteobacteria bacterium]
MSGFTGKSETYLNTPITNDGFFPDVVLGDFQRDYRIPTKYEQETVTDKLLISIVRINEQLEEQQALWILEGFGTLEAVTSKEVNGISILIIRYKEAVFCYAKALLIAEFASINRKDSALNITTDIEPIDTHWKTRSSKAVRRLLGRKTTISVELL